jgi:hypothetical protein
MDANETLQEFSMIHAISRIVLGRSEFVTGVSSRDGIADSRAVPVLVFVKK